MKKNDLKKVKMVLLDFGGVVSPEGYELGLMKLAGKLGIGIRRMHNIAQSISRNTGYIAGKVGEGVFWKKISSKFPAAGGLIRYRYLFLDNFVPRKEVIEGVRMLSGRYKTGLFSDQTNWIYEIDEKYSFIKYFDYSFVSYTEGFTKNEDEFYNIPVARTGIDAREIMLIDDKKKVLDHARRLGYKVFLFESVKGFMRLVDSLMSI